MNLYRLTSTYGENEHGYGLGNNDTMYWGHVEKVGGPVYQPVPGGPSVVRIRNGRHRLSEVLNALVKQGLVVEVGEDITP